MQTVVWWRDGLDLSQARDSSAGEQAARPRGDVGEDGRRGLPANPANRTEGTGPSSDDPDPHPLRDRLGLSVPDGAAGRPPLRRTRISGGAPGHARPLRKPGYLLPVRARARGRGGCTRLDRRATLVRRPPRHVGRVLLRLHPMGGGSECSPLSQSHRTHRDKYGLPRFLLPGWRVLPDLGTALGGGKRREAHCPRRRACDRCARRHARWGDQRVSSRTGPNIPGSTATGRRSTSHKRSREVAFPRSRWPEPTTSSVGSSLPTTSHGAIRRGSISDPLPTAATRSRRVASAGRRRGSHGF